MEFCRSGHSPPAVVLGQDIDVVKSYKYLGVRLNENLDWTGNTDVPAEEAEVLQSAGPFMTLWWHQPSFMGWSPGPAASQTGEEWTDL